MNTTQSKPKYGFTIDRGMYSGPHGQVVEVLEDDPIKNHVRVELHSTMDVTVDGQRLLCTEATGQLRTIHDRVMFLQTHQEMRDELFA